MRKWTKMVFGLGCAVAAFAALTVSQIDEAEACVGPPPADCGVAVNCALVADQMALTHSDEAIQAAFRAGLYLDQAVDAGHPICDSVLADPGTTYEAHFDLDGQCEDLNNPGSLNPDGLAQGTFDIHNNGVNRIGLEMDFDPGPTRDCQIGGDVTVEITPIESMQNWFNWWFGQPSLEITAACGDNSICLAQESPTVDGEAEIDVRLLDADGIRTSIGGKAEVFEYEVTNNTDQSFLGNFQIDSKNTDSELQVTQVLDPDEMDDAIAADCDDSIEPPEEPADCEDEEVEHVCGCDLETYANTCELENAGVDQLSEGKCLEPGSGFGGYSAAMEGDGDNFPIAFLDEVDDIDGCIPLPDNPGSYTSPSLERDINLAPGESQIVEIVQRSWGLCADGSCSRTSVSVTGVLGDEPISACAGGALMINEQGDDPDMPDDDYITLECDDDSTPTTPRPWPEDGEEEWYVPDPPDTNDSGIPDYIEDLHPDLPDSSVDADDYRRDTLLDTDTSGNGIPDYIELLYDADNFPFPSDHELPEELSDYPMSLLEYDSSGNGVSDYEEIFIYGSDPFSPHDPVFFYPYITIDTNGNGVPDFIEVAYGYDPLDDDSPANPADYTWEALLETTTGDNPVPHMVQILFGYDPTDDSEPADHENYSEAALKARDSDGDGLSDYEEIYEYHTHPLNADTDNDGIPDGAEIDAGTDPLDPYDPEDAANSATPYAGISFDGSSDDLSTLVFAPGSEFTNIHTFVQRATAVPLNAQSGRIFETIDIDPESLNGTDTIELEIPFEASPLNEDSPYEVNQVEMGEKFSDDGYDGTYLSGKGKIRLDSNPFTIFDVLYQASVWATDDHTGATERLMLDEMEFLMEEDGFRVVLSAEIPSYDFTELRVFHDFSANERLAYTQVCGPDEPDTVGNGYAGCDDPYCEDHPACDGETGDDTGSTDPDAGPTPGPDAGPTPGPDAGDDDDDDDSTGPGQNGESEVDSGCGGCVATGTGQPVGFAIMLLLGFALMVRNRRRGVEESSVRIR